MKSETYIDEIKTKYAHEPLFRDAVTEFMLSVLPYLESVGADTEMYARLERLIYPERTITFKVVWENDQGELEINTGYRVQFNSALGPYKGGLRFDGSVTLDTLKFLGFEQIFKNALTGLPLGGGKGGSDFNPKGKSDNEIRRFCTAFMTELFRHIGSDTDVPAGDIGVGGREIGYLYGAYKRIKNEGGGALTGKGITYGGSLIRTEATGYGAVYFIKEMLAHAGKNISGMRAVVSGSGNVATHVAEKFIQEGALVLTLSDREGYIFNSMGLTEEDVVAVKRLKEKQGSLKDLDLRTGTEYHAGKPWKNVGAEIYVPSATQGEIDETDAEAIVAQGALLVAEGANMPSTLSAMKVFEKNNILFGPAKAVNAGGVAVSGLEMSQNASHLSWTREEVDEKLRSIMKKIHETCLVYGKKDGFVDYVTGANVGGFVRVFEAMKQLGW